MDLDLWDFSGRVKLIAKFHRTDLVICSHSRERKTPSDSQINTISHVIEHITRKQAMGDLCMLACSNRFQVSYHWALKIVLYFTIVNSVLL